jgi:hypothetical protein
LAALAAGCAVAVGVASCVTGSPADVPQPPLLGPIIVQDAVQPPSGPYLTVLPEAGFVVPVRVFDPISTITCAVFIDFDPGMFNNTGTSIGCANTPPALDGGVTSLTFTINPIYLGDPNACHTIQCFVAEVFDPGSPHTPGNSLGADPVTWHYTPNGPGGCDYFDGSDGAFPPADAAMDGLPLTVDAVGPPL